MKLLVVITTINPKQKMYKQSLQKLKSSITKAQQMYDKDEIKLLEYVDKKKNGIARIQNEIWSTCKLYDTIFIHDDMLVDKSWLSEYLYWIWIRKLEGGIFGTKLHFPNGLIQHFGGEIKYDGDAFHPDRGVIDVGQHSKPKEVGFVSYAGHYVKREVIDKIGGIDKKFIPYGYEDADHCMRAKRAGFKIWCLPTSAIHYESFTVSKVFDLKKLLDRNREYFMKKHKLTKYTKMKLPIWI